MGQGHTTGGARAGEPYEVLRADVRSEDGRPDDEPAEIAAGEEVIVGGVLALPDHPPRKTEQQGEIQPNDQPIQAGHAIPSAALGVRTLHVTAPVSRKL